MMCGQNCFACQLVFLCFGLGQYFSVLKNISPLFQAHTLISVFFQIFSAAKWIHTLLVAFLMDVGNACSLCIVERVFCVIDWHCLLLCHGLKKKEGPLQMTTTKKSLRFYLIFHWGKMKIFLDVLKTDVQSTTFINIKGKVLLGISLPQHRCFQFLKLAMWEEVVVAIQVKLLCTSQWMASRLPLPRIEAMDKCSWLSAYVFVLVSSISLLSKVCVPFHL